MRKIGILLCMLMLLTGCTDKNQCQQYSMNLPVCLEETKFDTKLEELLPENSKKMETFWTPTYKSIAFYDLNHEEVKPVLKEFRFLLGESIDTVIQRIYKAKPGEMVEVVMDNGIGIVGQKKNNIPSMRLLIPTTMVGRPLEKQLLDKVLTKDYMFHYMSASNEEHSMEICTPMFIRNETVEEKNAVSAHYYQFFYNQEGKIHSMRWIIHSYDEKDMDAKYVQPLRKVIGEKNESYVGEIVEVVQKSKQLPGKKFKKYNKNLSYCITSYPINQEGDCYIEVDIRGL